MPARSSCRHATSRPLYREMMMRLSFAVAASLALGASAEWEHLGPRNIFNDAAERGESGTLADAASPAANPRLIYTGGSNNGAASGILKSTDGGTTWLRKSKGLFDTRISAVLISPDDPKGGHVYAGTFTTGIFESTDGAETWQPVPATATLGHIRGLSAGVIGGVKHIIAAGAPGIASTPVAANTSDAQWTVAPYPPPRDPEFTNKAGNRFTAAIDPSTGSTVLGSCVRVAKTDAAFSGEAFLGTFSSSAASIEWKRPGGRNISCATLGLHPTNPEHFIYSNSTWGEQGASNLGNTWGSFDGGATVKNLRHPTQAFHVAIDEVIIRKTVLLVRCYIKNDHFTKTGSGQT